MSHIDSFRHQLVGSFIGLPVYLPLEDIRGDFNCTTRQLVIGGGSGEHPALVLQDPPGAVAEFLSEALRMIKLDAHEDKAWRAAFEPFLPDRICNVITFHDWDVETFHSFYELCRSPGAENPFSGERGCLELEYWLVRGLGEFVFYALPHLAEGIVGKLQQPYGKFDQVLFNNIMVVPPNMPVYANGGNAFFPPQPKASVA